MVLPFCRYFKYQGINSIRVNPLRPELIAVASQSPHVHVFDRRMCSLRSLESDVTVSLRTGYTITGFAHPVMQLKYPVRELLWQSSKPPDVERDIRPSYVSWASNGDKLVANYSSGPAVTWSTCMEMRNGGDQKEEVHSSWTVKALRTGGSMYEVADPNEVDAYWEKYKRTVPFDVDGSMKDLYRVSTCEDIIEPRPTAELPSSPWTSKKVIARASLEELQDIEINELVRDIAQEYSMFVHEYPGTPDLEKEFLWLLFGEYTLRTGHTLACNLLYLVAHPLSSLNFEHAASFIGQMVARRLWPLRLVDDPDAPEGEWMAELEVVEYANSLLNMARSSWVNRHFHSKRKERTIGARYDRLFVEILEALLEEQEQRPGSFDREYWTGKGCYDAFGVSLSHVEAGYIEAWIKYFAQVGSGSADDLPKPNTPIMLLGSETKSFEQMYCYHSNENTDIKEAVFFGADNSFVLCASDSGTVLAYDEMGELVCYLETDAAIANCVRPHPRLPIIAWYVTSDHVFAGTNARPDIPPTMSTILASTYSALARIWQKLGYRRDGQNFLPIFGNYRACRCEGPPPG